MKNILTTNQLGKIEWLIDKCEGLSYRADKDDPGAILVSAEFKLHIVSSDHTPSLSFEAFVMTNGLNNFTEKWNKTRMTFLVSEDPLPNFEITPPSPRWDKTKKEPIIFNKDYCPYLNNEFMDNVIDSISKVLTPFDVYEIS